MGDKELAPSVTKCLYFNADFEAEAHLVCLLKHYLIFMQCVPIQSAAALTGTWAGQFTNELGKCKYVLIKGESDAVALFYILFFFCAQFAYCFIFIISANAARSARYLHKM